MIRVVPIVTPEGRLVRVITKGNLLRALRARFSHPNVWSQPVARWMAHRVLALRPRNPLRTAVEYVVASGPRSLPVIDGRAVVLGMYRRTLMTAFAGEVSV